MPPLRALEFHDSRVQSVEASDSGVRLTLSRSVHQSAADPAKGAGTSQDVELFIAAGRLQGLLPNGAWILEGRLVVGEQTHENVVPLPFEASGKVALELQAAGKVMRVVGLRVTVRAVGEATHVEESSS